MMQRYGQVALVLVSVLCCALTGAAWAGPTVSSRADARVDFSVPSLYRWSHTSVPIALSSPDALCVEDVQVSNVLKDGAATYGGVRLADAGSSGGCSGQAVPADTTTLIRVEIDRTWSLGRSIATLHLSGYQLNDPSKRFSVSDTTLHVLARMAWVWLPLCIVGALLLGWVTRTALPTARDRAGAKLGLARLQARVRALTEQVSDALILAELSNLRVKIGDSALRSDLSLELVRGLQEELHAVVDRHNDAIRRAAERAMASAGELEPMGPSGVNQGSRPEVDRPVELDVDVLGARHSALSFWQQLLVIVLLTVVLTATAHPLWDGSILGLAAAGALAFISDINVSVLVARATALSGTSKTTSVEPDDN